MSTQVAKYIDQLLTKPHLKPLIVGISGPQGLGKSYMVSHLLEHYRSTQPSLAVAGFLVDDFYLPRKQQEEVTERAKAEENEVLQGRGLPGTHDVPFLLDVFKKLKAQEPVKIPRYDKSAFSGKGDRAPEDTWQSFKNVDLVIMEGWFNGFRALEPGLFSTAYFGQWPSSIVQKHKFYHLQEVNEELAKFNPVWDAFDYFVFFDTDSTDNVYAWRQVQEEELRRLKGSGMTREQVVAFVDRYMPMYVLYYWRLCRGGTLTKGRNLRVRINEKWEVLGIEVV